MLISARARGYLCNHIMSVFSGSLFMKSRKREKGERGSELYMGQGELCKHIECVEGKRFLQKKSLPFLHNKRETEMTNSIILKTLFPLKLFHQWLKWSCFIFHAWFIQFFFHNLVSPCSKFWKVIPTFSVTVILLP